MCGICGTAGFVDEELLRRMCTMLTHRGPDEEGFYFDDEAALGMRRLNIIDLVSGHQPIHNEDKTVWIVYNGEIYNFKELRQDLEKKGHCFYTNTDTEVIVHLYEDYGKKCISYLRGMFAFAIWDVKEKRLFLSRDRLGIKPLYYAQIGQNLIFASELKAILAYEKISLTIDPYALDTYFSFLYIPAPQTIFQGIQKLLPGHCLIWHKGKLEIESCIGSPDYSEQENKYSEQEYLEKLQIILADVIKCHLISDVPIGVFLSGGMDSSTIVYYMSKVFPSAVKTFTIGYGLKDASYNELEKARLVAQNFGCEHYEYIVEPEMVKILPSIVRGFDEPFADSSAIVTYLISQQSRQKVTVALTGIGGDELFCGYPRYFGARISLLYEHLPFKMRKWFISIIEGLSEKNYTIGRIKRFIKGGTLPFKERYLSWVSMLTKDEKEKLYTQEFKNLLARGEYFSQHLKYFDILSGKNPLEQLLSVECNTYLPGDLLCMADRMSMSHSLEVRVPFCDHKLVEFSSSIPFSLKTKGFNLKYLLKKDMRGKLPAEILKQKKMGFMVPLGRWLTHEMKSLVQDYLSEETIRKKGYFRYDYIKWMLDEHNSGRRNFSDQLWALIVFEIWHQIYKERV